MNKNRKEMFSDIKNTFIIVLRTMLKNLINHTGFQVKMFRRSLMKD